MLRIITNFMNLIDLRLFEYYTHLSEYFLLFLMASFEKASNNLMNPRLFTFINF